ncbi:MAG: methionyl-tRNA formyltransferase [Acutalibacteraceae bacterium]
MKLVFMGTPDFSVPCIEALYNAGHEIAAVYTQPDKPKGRGYTLTPPPVKVFATEHNLTVYQPTSLKNNEEALKLLSDIAPDVVVVVAYGKILPKAVLDLPKYGCINVHASLLPKYRGAAPIQWSIINGEKHTGVTTMMMDVGIDTGDMLLSETTNIDINENAEQLHDRLAQMGAKLIVKTLDELKNGTLTRTKQDSSLSNYAPMLERSLSKIDWSDTCFNIHNKVRGLYPWPSAITTVNGKTLKIHKTAISDKKGQVGEILSLNPLVVACGEGSVELLEVQLEGKKRMTASDFLRGNKLDSKYLGI